MSSPSPGKPTTYRAPSPDFRDKLLRALWTIVWFSLFRFSPVPLHGWRRVLLRLFGAKIGKQAHPYPSARIWAPWNLTMGERSCLSAGVDCYCVAPIQLGADSVVSQRAFLCAASHDFRESGFPLVVGEIVIGDGAWVAAEAFIGPGVTIGERAVIGARAVVTKNIPASTVVAGNPATIISQR
jgi:putative colanic acid biosynthesis acetyltransferase WcaF